MGAFTIPDDGSVYITNGTISDNTITADNPDAGSDTNSSTYAIRIHAAKKERNMQKAVVSILKPDSPSTKTTAENTNWFIDMHRNTKQVNITGTMKEDSNTWATGFDTIYQQISWVDRLFNYNGAVKIVWGLDATAPRDDDNWVRPDGFTGFIKKAQVQEDAIMDSISGREVPVIIQIEKGEDKTV